MKIMCLNIFVKVSNKYFFLNTIIKIPLNAHKDNQEPLSLPTFKRMASSELI